MFNLIFYPLFIGAKPKIILVSIGQKNCSNDRVSSPVDRHSAGK